VRRGNIAATFSRHVLDPLREWLTGLRSVAPRGQTRIVTRRLDQVLVWVLTFWWLSVTPKRRGHINKAC
jgi:hypothetical protein